MTQYNKSTLETLLANPAYVDEAIRLIGTNQTADELQSKNTHHQNGEGFSAAYARTGTRLYEFVTGIQTRTGKKKWAPKSLSHPVANRVFSRYISNHGLNNALELGRKIAMVHWRQLEGLTSSAVTQLPTGGETKPKKPAAKMVTIEGVELVGGKGKAIKVRWDSRYIWLPKSQVSVVPDAYGDVTITMPEWLAGKKGMGRRSSGFQNPRANPAALYDGRDAPRIAPPETKEEQAEGPQPGTRAFTATLMASMESDDFDWDAWKAS
jgi:hypothetical protein